MRGSRDGIELESLAGLAGILEEVHGDVCPLVLDGGRTGEESVDHIIQLGGSHGGEPLQGGTEGGLEDGEALEGAGGGVVARHVGHWGIRVWGGRRDGGHVVGRTRIGQKMSGCHLDASDANPDSVSLSLSLSLSLSCARGDSLTLFSLFPSWSRRVQRLGYGQHGVREGEAEVEWHTQKGAVRMTGGVFFFFPLLVDCKKK